MIHGHSMKQSVHTLVRFGNFTRTLENSGLRRVELHKVTKPGSLIE
jgi:hypothetical protein